MAVFTLSCCLVICLVLMLGYPVALTLAGVRCCLPLSASSPPFDICFWSTARLYGTIKRTWWQTDVHPMG